MGRLQNNKEFLSLMRVYLLIIIFWIVISIFFPENNLPADGQKYFGIPYGVLIIYWSRKSGTLYDYYFDFSNLLLDFVFITLVSIFYFFLFRHRKNMLLTVFN